MLTIELNTLKNIKFNSGESFDSYDGRMCIKGAFIASCPRLRKSIRGIVGVDSCGYSSIFPTIEQEIKTILSKYESQLICGKKSHEVKKNLISYIKHHPELFEVI